LGTTAVLLGEPGIGKTTLWEAGLEAARESGFAVLHTRGSEAEASLSFSALADLVRGIDTAVLARLPGPQLRAIEVAIRRADAAGPPPDPLAICVGLLDALLLMSERQPLLIAVDDLQWLDSSSAEPLTFAARRLSDAPVRFLLSRRSGPPTALEQALQSAGVVYVELAGLSLGATDRLLAERLGLVLSRRVVLQVHKTSRGNPLFALELGRLVIGHGAPEVGAELPFPHLIEDVFGARVRDLPDSGRRTLLATALSAGLQRSELARIVDPLALEEALESGLVVVDQDAVRPSHPLLAATARHLSTATQRRELHLDLATAVEDPILRARHLAMATMAPDADLAGITAAAADMAAARGATEDAEELAAQALRLTPRGAPECSERLLALARRHLDVGDLPRAAALLEARIGEFTPGRSRAMAHVLLGEAAPDVAGNEAQMALALAEAGTDPVVRAEVFARKSLNLATDHVEHIDEAEIMAQQALSAARSAAVEAGPSLAALAWARVLRGHPIEDLYPSHQSLPAGASIYHSSIDRPLGARLVFRGQLEQARELYGQLQTDASERGELRMSMGICIQMCELELRAGEVSEVTRLLEELRVWSALEGLAQASARLNAMLAAVTGVRADATRWARAVLGDGECPPGGVWQVLEVRRALGIAALLDHDPAEAAGQLRSVWEHTRRAHVDDPGAFPVAADLVEALVQVGDIDSAREVAMHVRGASEEQDHPWGLATAQRCEASLRLVDCYEDGAAAELVDAAAAYGALGLAFDRARSLLLLGKIQRRFNKSSAARHSLDAAAAQFETSGCSGWADEARTELARVSGRRSKAKDQLTASERQAADLAARGMSNKEIAARLFVSVNTVEVHLSRAYAKLGVRSRGQLAQRLGGAPLP
jgi:DNA-binding CsgD family transcriptional regulator